MNKQLYSLISYIDDCKYSHWSEWSICNASCGQTGNKIRAKSLITIDPSQPNPLCAREIYKTSPCTSDPCPCITGVNCTCDLTNWSDWSQCSLPCGGGQRERTRQYETNSTEDCTAENLREIQSCNVDCCPIDGKLTSWSIWTACTKKCGSGIQKRYRSCTAPPPSCKGKPCESCTMDTRVCNTNPCGK
jgi:hemicentin